MPALHFTEVGEKYVFQMEQKIEGCPLETIRYSRETLAAVGLETGDAHGNDTILRHPLCQEDYYL